MVAYFYHTKDSTGRIPAEKKHPLFAVGGGQRTKRNAYFLFGEIKFFFPWNEAKINEDKFVFNLVLAGTKLGGKEVKFSYGVNPSLGGVKVGDQLVCDVILSPPFAVASSHAYINQGFFVAFDWAIRPGSATGFNLFNPPFLKLWLWIESGGHHIDDVAWNLFIVRMA